jgi:hypothetical protein
MYARRKMQDIYHQQQQQSEPMIFFIRFEFFFQPRRTADEGSDL